DWNVVAGDTTYFLLGAGKLVAIGALVTSGIFMTRLVKAGESLKSALLVPIMYWWAMLALLALAYVTKAQPVLLPRYGLMFFALGLPLFAWALQGCLVRSPARWVKAAICLGVVVVCLNEFHKQLPTLWKVRDDYQ